MIGIDPSRHGDNLSIMDLIGPQKGPSTVGQIMAQTNQVRKAIAAIETTEASELRKQLALKNAECNRIRKALVKIPRLFSEAIEDDWPIKRLLPVVSAYIEQALSQR